MKVKEMRRPVAGGRTVSRLENADRNFFADLKEARNELEAFSKGSPLSARLISERAVRRLRVKIGS